MWPRDVNDVTHRKRARRILGDLRKVSELSSRSEEDCWLSGLAEARPVALSRVRTWFGTDGKVSIERWYLSPYVEKPLNSKIIKSFVPERRSRQVFSCFGIPMLSIYRHYERSAYRYEYVYLLYSHIINMHRYTYTCRIHIDAIITTSEDFFLKIYLSLYWKGSKRVTQGFTVRGRWRPNRTATYCLPLLWLLLLCLSRSPWLLNRRPGGPLRWVLAFSTTSCHQRVWSPN